MSEKHLVYWTEDYTEPPTILEMTADQIDEAKRLYDKGAKAIAEIPEDYDPNDETDYLEEVSKYLKTMPEAPIAIFTCTDQFDSCNGWSPAGEG